MAGKMRARRRSPSQLAFIHWLSKGVIVALSVRLLLIELLESQGGSSKIEHGTRDI